MGKLPTLSLSLPQHIIIKPTQPVNLPQRPRRTPHPNLLAQHRGVQAAVLGVGEPAPAGSVAVWGAGVAVAQAVGEIQAAEGSIEAGLLSRRECSCEYQVEHCRGGGVGGLSRD